MRPYHPIARTEASARAQEAANKLNATLKAAKLGGGG